MEDLPVLNLVLGTAGHVDHGKTALIHRLTGIDPDRLKEEKARGMTIDIGYAHMVVDRRLRMGIIDVPGHERFIKNMVAGSTGVGLVILVVAADDGVMPQTREHLEIMQLLGVELGLVALNKIDLVDPDLAELAAEEIREFLKGTFLEAAPLIPVSAETGEGFEELTSVIDEMVKKATPPPDSGPFYMPVQRSFPAEGFGTVVTGVPIHGRVRLGDLMEVVPYGKQARIRVIEAYGNRLEEAAAGHRSALNLGEVGHREIRRGDVIADRGYLRPYTMAECRLSVLKSRSAPVKSQTQVHFHVGCAETLARMHLLDAEAIEPGASGLVQLRFEHPVVFAPGDNFVVRGISPPRTIGGGKVIGGSEKKLKPLRPWVIEAVSLRERSLAGPQASVEAALAKSGFEPRLVPELAVDAFLRTPEAQAVLSDLAGKGFVTALGQGDRYVLSSSLADLMAVIEKELTAFHEANPLSEGMDRVELRNRTGAGKLVFDAALAALEASGRAVSSGQFARLASFSVSLQSGDQGAIGTIEKAFLDGGFKPPSPQEALDIAGAQGGRDLYKLLVTRGRLVEITRDDIVFHKDVIERIRNLIVEEIREKGELITSSFRDRLQTTRKYIIPLLEYFDKIGLTIRVDNSRSLREHARGGGPGRT